MPTKRETVLRAFQENAGQSFQPRQIWALSLLGLNRHTVRRIIGELYRARELDRIRISKRRFRYFAPELGGPLYRYAYGITSFPLHSTKRERSYYGAIIEAWSRDKALLGRKASALRGILERALARFVQSREYARELIIDGNGEGIQEVEEGPEGRYEWRIEHEASGPVESGHGDLDRA